MRVDFNEHGVPSHPHPAIAVLQIFNVHKPI